MISRLARLGVGGLVVGAGIVGGIAIASPAHQSVPTVAPSGAAVSTTMALSDTPGLPFTGSALVSSVLPIGTVAVYTGTQSGSVCLVLHTAHGNPFSCFEAEVIKSGSAYLASQAHAADPVTLIGYAPGRSNFIASAAGRSAGADKNGIWFLQPPAGTTSITVGATKFDLAPFPAPDPNAPG